MKQAYELQPENSDARGLYVAALVQTKQFAEVVRIAKAHVEASPSEVQGYFTLAAAYYAVGDRQSSLETLQQIADKFPQAKAQADNYIQQVKNGTAKFH